MKAPHLPVRKFNVFLLAWLLLMPFMLRADSASDAPIDWARARQLYQREQRGERLTPDEQAYLDRAKAERNRGNGPAGVKPPGPPRESTGLVPLTQLNGDQKYKGLDGGLYGKGINEPPESQRRAAMDAAAKVVRLDADGKPSPTGKIVLMSIGMSNTTMEFSLFKRLADADPEKSPDVTMWTPPRAARTPRPGPRRRRRITWSGGKPIGDSSRPASRPGRRELAHQVCLFRGQARAAEHRDGAVAVGALNALDLGGNAGNRLCIGDGRKAAFGEVVWIKQALMAPSRLGEFPAHAKVLQYNLVTILNFAKAHYPNLRLAYLTSRMYAGYATTPLNPEPYAYESAFAVRGVIEDQIKGEAKLNADSAKGEVRAPVVLWGKDSALEMFPLRSPLAASRTSERTPSGILTRIVPSFAKPQAAIPFHLRVRLITRAS